MLGQQQQQNKRTESKVKLKNLEQEEEKNEWTNKQDQAAPSIYAAQHIIIIHHVQPEHVDRTNNSCILSYCLCVRVFSLSSSCFHPMSTTYSSSSIAGHQSVYIISIMCIILVLIYDIYEV